MGGTSVREQVPHGTLHLHTATNYIQWVGSCEEGRREADFDAKKNYLVISD